MLYLSGGAERNEARFSSSPLCAQIFEWSEAIAMGAVHTFGEHDDDDERLVEADARADVDQADDVRAELRLDPHALGRTRLLERRVGRQAQLRAFRQLHLRHFALRAARRHSIYFLVRSIYSISLCIL